MDTSSFLWRCCVLLWVLLDITSSHPSRTRPDHTSVWEHLIRKIRSTNKDSLKEDEANFMPLPDSSLKPALSTEYPNPGHMEGEFILPLPDDFKFVLSEIFEKRTPSNEEEQWLARPLDDSELDFDNTVLNSSRKIAIPIKIELPPLSDIYHLTSGESSGRKKKRNRRKPKHRIRHSKKRRHRRHRKRVSIPLPSF